MNFPGLAVALDPRISDGPGGLFAGHARVYARPMAPIFRFYLIAMTGLSLGAAGQPDLGRITPVHTHDMRCAAAFAVVAARQAGGDPAALALPPLGLRGRVYMGKVGERVAREAGLPGDAVHDVLASAAQKLGPQGALAVAGPCLAELDAAVPRRPAPGPIDCFAILDAYARVLTGRDPASPLGATLRSEAAALAPTAHDPATDRLVDAARARVRDALTGGDGTIDADDFAACRARARG